MEASIFTKIINGDIPSHKVYEDDLTFAFMDINPIQKGQIVVVPKTQRNFVWDLAEVDYVALMKTVQRVGIAVRKTFDQKNRVGVFIEGLDIQNHAHVVVLPFDNSEEFHAKPEGAEPNHKELAEIAEKIRSNL